MTAFLKQSTAVDLAIGPFLDSTDGNTVESGLTITQPDVRLSKNGAAWAQKSAAQTLSHQENGYYQVNLSTTDTNTVGLLQLHVHESGALPVFMTYYVVEEAIYDALFAASATGALPVSSGGITTASFAAGAIDAAAIAANAIGSSEIADGAITAAKIATDAIDADAIADGAITSGVFATGAITATAIATDAIGSAEIADGAITSAKFATGAITAGVIAADAIGASELAADAVTEIQSGLATSAALQTVDDNVDAILVDTGTTLDGKIDTIDGIVDAILVDTGTTLPAQITSEINDVQADIAALNDVSLAAIIAALKDLDRRNTADGDGGGTDTLELAAADQEASDFYNGCVIILLEGAGSDVSAREATRTIIDYDNATNTITVDANWSSAVDATTVYLILGG